MTEKQCSKRKVFQPLNDYKNECKQCRACSENIKRHREHHREGIKQYAKECCERRQEESNDKKKEPLECTICKCEVRKYTMKRHEESIKHQMNINSHNPIQKTKQPKQTLPSSKPNISISL